MGCKGSKLDEQEAVALCRGRADLLAAAVRHRYALADAHAALAESLFSVSASLHLLMANSASPQLTLPSTRKVQSPPHPSSHLHFSSSSGSEASSLCSSPTHRVVHDQLQHPHPLLPLPHFGYGYAPEPQFAYPPGSLQFYYARSCPPPASVAIEQRMAEPGRVYFGSCDAASGYLQCYPYGGEPVVADRAGAPPSPPKASSWDFLNVFESYEVYDNYCYDAAASSATAEAAYTPRRSSREVREEEGIPELEEDDVVVKEVASEYSTLGSGGTRSRRSSLGGVSSSIAEIDEHENTIVDKGVVGRGSDLRQRPPPQRNVAASVPPPRTVVNNADLASEIKVQFVRAADAVRALAPTLEVGRRRYHPRSSVYHVSTRMVSAIALPHSGYGGQELLEFGGGEKVASERSLSYTLQKLYIWERKLYDEVKAEEKMRLLLAKNSKRLKFLDQKGAEAQKIDATRNLVRKLLTKIRIAVRVIAKISKKINRVRDEELWPQINALIQGFVKMWHDKLDCYQIQCQVISEAKNLDSIVSDGNGRDWAMELELELIKWIANFSSWVNAQRSFIKALNGWLALCLNYEPEETADGVPPYSPGRVGAPLVFVICNSWSQAMDRISEKDVVTAMQALVSSVRHLWEQQTVEQSEQIIAIREREKWTKILERKALEINKEADALNRKLALIPGRQRLLPTTQTYQATFHEASNLQISLRLLLQALENFAANSLHAFEEILRHAEDERLSRENAKVS